MTVLARPIPLARRSRWFTPLFLLGFKWSSIGSWPYVVAIPVTVATFLANRIWTFPDRVA